MRNPTTECKLDNKVIIIFIIFIRPNKGKFYSESLLSVKAATCQLSEGLWVGAEEQEVVCWEQLQVRRLRVVEVWCWWGSRGEGGCGDGVAAP